MSDLTPRQTEILRLIQRAIAETGMPPTRAEIASELGFKSPNAAEEHLRALARHSSRRRSDGVHKFYAARARPRRSTPTTTPSMMSGSSFTLTLMGSKSEFSGINQTTEPSCL